MKYWVLLIAGAVSPYLFNDTFTIRAGLIVWLVLVFSYATACYFCFCRVNSSCKISLPEIVRKSCFYMLIFVGAFVFTTLNLVNRLDQRLPLSMDKIEVCLAGIVRGLPVQGSDYLRFRFQASQDSACKEPHRTSEDARYRARRAFDGQLFNVYWHQNRAPESGLPDLRPGERWQLILQLRTNRATVNFVGTDSERWAFASGEVARGFVLNGAIDPRQKAGWFNPDVWRERALNKIRQVSASAPAMRLIAALAIADRRELGHNDKAVLMATGTGHLLAISGLHIGLAAVLGYWTGRGLLLLLSMGVRHRLAISLPWAFSWLAALGYAVLAGFGVSTQRALIMLSVAVLVMLCRRKIHPASGWLIAMGLVLLLDPFAPLRVGFWFSFLAVAVLLFMFSPRFGNLPGWKKMLYAQAGITLTMAPLGMYFFQQSSLPGLLANLVAIPLVSFVSVPLILSGLLAMWLPGPFGGWLFNLAGWSLHWLFEFLQLMASWQPDFMVSGTFPRLALVLVAMLGALLLLMPRGLPVRAAALLMLLPVLMPAAKPPAKNTTVIDMLDVGQGLAVLVGTDEYLLVYDTGPGSGLPGGPSRDTVKGTIQPAIAHRAVAPDLMVVSHADLDHVGGLDSLRKLWPSTAVMASLPQPIKGITACQAGLTWQADGLEFKILHPTIGLPYLGNDSSCVLSIRGEGAGLLLSGDISKAVEQRLVSQSLASHQLLTVSHHGSASSSTPSFIAAVQPALALNSAAINNRFDFPREEVKKRFNFAGITVLNTADCGGLRISSSPTSELEVTSARKQRDAIWRFKASDFCP